MDKATIVLISSILIATQCFSQFDDSVHYRLRFASTGVVNKTKVSYSYVFKNEIIFDRNKDNVSFSTGLSWIYGEQRNALTNNDFSAHGSLDFARSLQKLYYWGLLNYDKSYSLKINHRFQIGAGIAYDIIKKISLKINISDGILYEQGDLVDAGLGHDVYQIPRNSLRLRYHWALQDKLIVDGVHFYQPSLKNFGDYIITALTNVAVKLNDWLSVTVGVTYNKVYRTRRENILITYGLTIEKYF